MTPPVPTVSRTLSRHRPGRSAVAVRTATALAAALLACSTSAALATTPASAPRHLTQQDLLVSPQAASAATPPAVRRALEAAVHGPQRTPAYAKRDPYRHPVRTLEFFGIRPDMRVVEVLPGGGWYTEILAPFLRDQGQLIEATAPLAGTSGYPHRSAMAFDSKLAADPGVYGKVRLEPFELPNYLHLGAPDSADMVVTFNNMHDLMFENVHHEVTPFFLQQFMRSAYQVLKPGGVLGIAGHRCAPGSSLGTCFPLARLPQAFVIQQAEAAGFQLGGTSEILANPKDPRNVPVFFLPPSLADSSAAARRHYAAIGYADDYTLRFIKPAN